MAVIARLCDIENRIGKDVLLSQRPLKNSIPADEYVLATNAFQRYFVFGTNRSIALDWHRPRGAAA